MNSNIEHKQDGFKMNDKYKSFRVRIDPIFAPEYRHLILKFPLSDIFINSPSERELMDTLRSVYNDEWSIRIEEIIEFKQVSKGKYKCQLADGRWERN